MGPLEGGVLGPPAHRTCSNILYVSSDVSIFCNVVYITLYLEFVISYKIQASFVSDRIFNSTSNVHS